MSAESSAGLGIDPEVGRGMDVVRDRGYGLERHFATTEDGYILGLFRITPRKGSVPLSLARRPPVLLQARHAVA